MSTPTPQQAADRIIGTCEEFSDIADGQDLNDMSEEWLEEFDSLVERCECCGWWVESGDLDEGRACSEC
jgi:hypothetical protein